MSISTIRTLLQGYVLILGRSIPSAGVDAVLAWGRRPSAIQAIKIARKENIPVLTIEDGFIRSLGLGGDSPPLSIVFDDIGVYYDASGPSRLEYLAVEVLDENSIARAQRLQTLWCENLVSKYNNASADFHFRGESYVLVVDQTYGDASIQGGLANPVSFQLMLKAAIAENPHKQIIVKVHPDVVSGRKLGHFDLNFLSKISNLSVVADNVHMADVLRYAERVYVVTSQVGFEALLWKKPVSVFGAPFYSGWGLTDDRNCFKSERRKNIDIEQLVYAVFVGYTRYVHPETRQRCTPEALISWMGIQRKHRIRYKNQFLAVGFSNWKRPFVREFLGSASDVKFSSGISSPLDNRKVAVWGRRQDHILSEHGVSNSALRIEDGFLRSVGLGASFTRPLSWVIDEVGIYYDATRPSSLEICLRHHTFSLEQRLRALALKQRIISSGITKYNLPSSLVWHRPTHASKVILVPGQVESDASIYFGNGGVLRNIDLLKAVREDNPCDYIIYKPHPDVTAGLRDYNLDETAALKYCDEVITGASLTSLFANVDQVSVLTSLAGFEALLRGKTVVTYGRPFYAGWGLTDDRRMDAEVLGRRGRLLAIEELVYATLVLYPTYVSKTTRRFSTPERILDEIEDWRNETPIVPLWRMLASRLLRKR